MHQYDIVSAIPLWQRNVYKSVVMVKKSNQIKMLLSAAARMFRIIFSSKYPTGVVVGRSGGGRGSGISHMSNHLLFIMVTQSPISEEKSPLKAPPPAHPPTPLKSRRRTL